MQCMRILKMQQAYWLWDKHTVFCTGMHTTAARRPCRCDMAAMLTFICDVWSARRRCKRLISVAGFHRSSMLRFCLPVLERPPSLLATLRLDHRASYNLVMHACLPVKCMGMRVPARANMCQYGHNMCAC